MRNSSTTPELSHGSVEALFLKVRHGKDAAELASGAALTCVAGLGIDGDVHANRLSPRQILVTLQSELNALSISPGALHENMVISGATLAYFLPGAALVTSGGVEIGLTMYCEPCKRIEGLVPELAALIHRRGILGRVVAGGEIRRGDTIKLIPHRYVALPESVEQKFLDFIPTIPAGRVVRFGDVTTAMGVADSFVRAVPGYIRRSMGRQLPLHRVVNARGELPNIVPDQAAMLAAEGVRITCSHALASGAPKVDLQQYLWRG
ncbi:MAG TPA: MGMT family protein [Telluria sp.]